MGVPIYCPICGRYHDQTGTAGCPRPEIMVYPNEYNNPLPVNTIESKLDKIIELLQKIEYYLKTQNNK